VPPPLPPPAPPPPLLPPVPLAVAPLVPGLGAALGDEYSIPHIEKFAWLFIHTWACRFRISATAVAEILWLFLFTFRCILKQPPQAHKPYTHVDTKRWPKTFQQLGTPFDIKINRFKRFAICPNLKCGSVHTLEYALEHRRCQHFVRVPMEQPKEVRERQIAALQALVDRQAIDPDFELHRRKRDREAAKKRFEKLTRRCGAILLKRTNVTMSDVEQSAAAQEAKAADRVRAAEIAADGVHDRPFTVERGLSKHPRLLYNHISLIDTLATHMMRPQYEQKCSIWQTTRYRRPDGQLDFSRRANHTEEGAEDTRLRADIYDGDAWHRYLYVDTRTDKPWTARAQEKAEKALKAWTAAHPGDAISADEDPFRFKRALLAGLAGDSAFGLALNIDWFQPFKMAGSYSVGAIYMTNLNLPREERYLLQNIILIGILPGPHETSRLQLQCVLEKLVDELLQLHDGSITRPTLQHPCGRKLRAFLLCVICDEPASRATCGFMNHAAKVNCAYCTSAKVGHNDLTSTGADHKWKLRTDGTHRAHALAWSRCGIHPDLASLVSDASAVAEDEEEEKQGAEPARASRERRPPRAAAPSAAADAAAPAADGAAQDASDADEDKIEEDEVKRDGAEGEKKEFDHIDRTQYAKDYGSRYCALMRLQYWDSVRGAPLDVMHNVWLGLCKAVMGALMHDYGKGPILTKADLKAIQEFIDKSECPSNIGRIPGKIASKCSTMKAAEWRNLFAIFLVPALYRIRAVATSKGKVSRITDDVMHLVLGVQEVGGTLQRYTIKASDIQQVHALFILIIKDVETLFGRSAVTPNMHWSCHLREMLLDYGPAASWWCNAYERYNGLLVDVPFTPAHVEICLIRRFIALIDCSQIVQEKAAAKKLEPHDARAIEMGADDVVTSESYAKISAMMHTSIDKQAEGSAEGMWSKGLSQDMIRTAGGRRQHVYAYTNETWEAMHNSLVELCEKQHEDTRAIGCEPFPGRFMMGEVATRGIKDISRWPEEWNVFITPDLFIESLTTHYAISYEKKITRNYEGFTQIKHDSWREHSHPLLKERVQYIRDKFGHRISTRVELYTSMLIGSERYGSKMGGRSQKSSFVRVTVREWAGRTHEPVNLWGQVQFYFTHTFPLRSPSQDPARYPVDYRIPPEHLPNFKPTKHYFAVVRYYEHCEEAQRAQFFCDKDMNPDIRSEVTGLFPLFSSKFEEKPGPYSVIPIHNIAARIIPWKPKDHADIVQILHIPSKLHA
jgi:hypothetical protein